MPLFPSLRSCPPDIRRVKTTLLIEALISSRLKDTAIKADRVSSQN